MIGRDDGILLSASDLVNFMGCAHASALDLHNLASPAIFPADDGVVALLQEKGIEHERRYLERLRAEGRSVIEIASEGGLDARAAATRAALRDGPDVIYQGAFLDGRWHGYSDFLLRVDAPSELGAWSYEPADTKLARKAKPKHLLQLCVYADLLEAEQGVPPARMHVVLGDNSVTTVRVDAIAHYFAFARQRFEAHVDAPPGGSTATPCGHCGLCRWLPTCEAAWDAADHLSIVAGLTRAQGEALRTAGIGTIPALASTAATTAVAGMSAPTFERLVGQARLQAGQRATGERAVERLPFEEGKGLARLPAPDPGDMFFDMEGDPLHEDGLEYLFGIVEHDRDGERFQGYWGHDRDGERRAFEATVDHMTSRLAASPSAHVYHYASYEETALKKLAMLHGTREAEVDDLLRNGKLVDLYKVVREAVRTSEPGYSIKNMERFYLGGGKREGEVTTAGDSIVIYERWRNTGEQALLDEIERYNRLDCTSTRACRDWLAAMRPPAMPWRAPAATAANDKDVERRLARTEAERATAALAADLLAGPDGDRPWLQLVVDLLEFHKREAKPSWWAMFARAEADHEALLDDAECLAGLIPDPSVPPRADKRSVVHAFRFPPQDFKLKPGDKPKLAGSLEPVGEVVTIDEDALSIELKVGPSRSPPQAGDALIPEGPVGDAELRAAVHRYAHAVRNGDAERYGAVTSILRRDLPRITGRPAGTPVAGDAADTTASTIDALVGLDRSHLLVQGPPGSGKTYTSSQAIVALLARGARVGISSNGHKAINQLLGEVEALAMAQGLSCRGIKKNSRPEQALGTGRWIEETTDNKAVTPAHQLVAGTAWTFAREEHDQAFDYIFIDEAGQVGLANVVAMGVAARNVVLVGDQMQLAQPIQGTHPRESGTSALEHLLEGHATVPPERGIFLGTTRRMHPDLCRFVSDAVYDGRLRSADDAGNQRLHADPAADRDAIAAAGLRFVEVESAGCTQRSRPEAERLASTYAALLGGRWTDSRGVLRTIGLDDILVVSPYNMQVELLRRTLPPGARVGTVDKFQGQEAAVVLVSMTTSSGDDLPRDIGFLYSRNRLNVAVSRARCLAVIYANPRLLAIPCNTVEQMRLVNGLCWAKRFSDEQTRTTAL